jgi:hypothetical protein
MAQEPRGIRNNNPGNIEWGSPWQGLVPQGKRTDTRFAQFVDAPSGIRAIAVTLITYYDKRKAADGSKIDSVKEVIDRWAPPNENDTKAYSAQVALLLGVDPKSETLNLHDYATLRGLVEGIIRHENGKGPLTTANTWYKDDVIDEALRRAGVVPTEKKIVTTETVSAAGAGAVGLDQLVGVLPTVTQAVTSSRDDLTSGDWSRIIIGVIMVSAAIALAYSHYRKQKLATA